MRKLLAAVFVLVASTAFAQDAFRILPDAGGNPNNLIRIAPTYVNARSLAANVAEDTTVPTGAKRVLFSAACNFYAKRGGSATVPGDVTDGTAAELNPAAWYLDGSVTTIGVISTSACVVTVTYYK